MNYFHNNFYFADRFTSGIELNNLLFLDMISCIWMYVNPVTHWAKTLHFNRLKTRLDLIETSSVRTHYMIWIHKTKYCTIFAYKCCCRHQLVRKKKVISLHPRHDIMEAKFLVNLWIETIIRMFHPVLPVTTKVSSIVMLAFRYLHT